MQIERNNISLHYEIRLFDAGKSLPPTPPPTKPAECEKAAMDVKYNTDTKIEDNSRAFKLQKANFDKEVNTAVSICLEVKFVSLY